jgi:hypothetical protein
MVANDKPLWYLMVTSLVHSGYPLWYLMVTLLILSDKHSCSFCLLIWYLLSNPFEPSDYFLFPPGYPLVSSDYPFVTFCLPIWYTLVNQKVPKI